MGKWIGALVFIIGCFTAVQAQGNKISKNTHQVAALDFGPMIENPGDINIELLQEHLLTVMPGARLLAAGEVNSAYRTLIAMPNREASK